MTGPQLLALLLGAAVALGWVRLTLWQARANPRARRWRVALLVALQPLAALLLYLTLVPPPRAGTAGTLVIATADAPRIAAIAVGDALVALPEAPPLSGAARVPDLATALRRHPGTTRLRIIGQGLPPRDRAAATGLPLDFDHPAPPPGLAALSLPSPVAPGAAFTVAGNVTGVPGGRADLVDPAGQVIASVPLSAAGGFMLAAAARAPGPADFTLRLRDAAGRPLETAAVPIIAAVPLPPRVLVVAGSAGPDLKYLRRWATDAGIPLKASIAAGSGFDIGDAPPRIDAANLSALDLLVLDERSWAGLAPGQRTAVSAAIRGGLGVVLRVTGPVSDAVRRDWAGLGLPLATTERPVRIGGAALTRLAFANPGSGAVPLVADDIDTPIAFWRGLGQGRIGLWPVSDLYSLVLAGQAPRHARLWSTIAATLARPRPATGPTIPHGGTIGQRLALCDLDLPARIVAPDGARTALVPDGRCAVFFPHTSGWHTLTSGTHAALFHVASPGRARTAAEARLATWQLRGAVQPTRDRAAAAAARGASWPWLIAWLIVTGLLWWFERSRFGRR